MHATSYVSNEALAAKAAHLRELHHGPPILVLPNAWDAASARIFEATGFDAIATTSGGIANECGFPDGEYISREEMLDAVRRITRTVGIPVTADMEAGYGSTPEAVAETARLTIQAGAVGMNLEDSVRDKQQPFCDLALQVEKIKAIREATDALNIPFVINARTDVFLRLRDEPNKLLKQAVERGNAYAAAGADCIFVMGVSDKQIITDLVRELNAPINIVAGVNSPTIAELEALGVARVTFGTLPFRTTVSLTEQIAKEIKASGTYTFGRDAMSHQTANGYFEKVANG